MASVATITPPGNISPGSIHWLKTNIDRGLSEKFTVAGELNPGLAAELLRRNPDNRKLRPAKLIQFANDIRAGRWADNGQPVIISADGLLNDGQHRCNAVIDANLTIPANFAFGYGRDSRLTLDQGTARNAADFLGMEGVHNSSTQAAIARIVIALELGEGKNLKASSYITNGDIMARVHSDTNIGAAATFAAHHAASTKAFCQPAVIGACYYVFRDINALEANAYMIQVCRGEGLKAKDPAYTVRDRLLNLGNKSREQRMHIIVRGWNAFRQGRTLSLVKISGDDNIPAAV